MISRYPLTSPFGIDCIELTFIISILSSPEFAITVFAKESSPVSVTKTPAGLSSFITLDSSFSVSKLASVSAEHPGKAAYHAISKSSARYLNGNLSAKTMLLVTLKLNCEFNSSILSI